MSAGRQFQLCVTCILHQPVLPARGESGFIRIASPRYGTKLDEDGRFRETLYKISR